MGILLDRYYNRVISNMSESELTCSKHLLIIALFKYVTSVSTQREKCEVFKTGIIHNENYVCTVYTKLNINY